MAANYGRDEGWFVQWRGIRVAELTDCRWADMFWDSYRFTLLTDQPDLVQALQSSDWDPREVTFRTRTTDQPALHAFASHPPRDGRVTVRSLHVSPDLTWMERAFLLLLRLGLVK
ncbi:hypothetical protein [Polyangium mundeleinium]|uniref:Uncharacterized protein n=1 Tax=Polyangium mundeleinium TaxID=2995306 RepID=A0ABT5F348_9BACT|nr:hypothetical protein [Polyangium mundeleinium]MDC0747491.1 hypothetical protein [Polyangium mundeleinium]